MNTSSWGPRAWLYLHTVAQNYDNNISKTVKNKEIFNKFFTHLQYVLPCIYCRNSYKEFIQEVPIDVYLVTNNLSEWVYKIHNKVNNKLRMQGLLNVKDPTLVQMQKKYNEILRKKDIKQADNMWYLLHTIAYNYDPEKHDLEKYRDMYNLIAETLPYGCEFGKVFKEAISRFPLQYECMMLQENLTSWLYLVHQYVNNKFELPMISYSAICAKYEKIRANCNAKKTGTCKLPDRISRCVAKTAKGRQCSRDHLIKSKYCTQHQNRSTHTH